MVRTMIIGLALPQEQWGEFFDLLSQDHRGQLISIQIIRPEFQDQYLIQNAPLLAMIYDRPGKGDNLMIEIGQDQVTYAHTIHSPTTVATEKNANGTDFALLITDAEGTTTAIKLPI